LASSLSSRIKPRSRPLRFGSETPRVWTPPLRELTPETSLGFSVIEFAAEVIHIKLFPWQRWLLIHALELLEDGSFRFRNVVVLVARQNGKSHLSQVLALWFMYVYGFDLVLGTAQDLDTAEEVWQGAVDLVEETPELNELKQQVFKVNGQKTLKLITGERYKVKAASRRAGRGLSGDLILLDELREHQSWDAWGAITKTTMAREHAQVWALSNAGDAASIVLRYLRKMAHAELGDPDGINGNDDPTLLLPDEDDELELEDDGTLGIFEWSAPPGCGIGDRDGWAQANPSLGYTITERTVASAARTDPEWVFRTEVLCQWSDGSLDGPFPAGSWEAGIDPVSSIPDGDPFVFAVDVSWDRSTSHIAVVGRREDGLLHGEVVASRVGTDWVIPWFEERVGTDGMLGVALQAKGAPVSSLLDGLKAVEGLTVFGWSGEDIGASCGAFYDLVRAGQENAATGIRHRPQPILDVAAATAATRPLGDAWAWDRKRSPTDIAPLVAVTCAVWAYGEPVEQELDPWFAFG
jgi:hypothetical protein